MRGFPFAFAVLLAASALLQPSHAQDDATLGAAEFGADLAAEIETVGNLCSQVVFVNPRVADEIQAKAFARLSPVPEAKAEALLDQKIAASPKDVAATDPESGCASTRDRMQQTGAPSAALFAA